MTEHCLQTLYGQGAHITVPLNIRYYPLIRFPTEFTKFFCRLYVVSVAIENFEFQWVSTIQHIFQKFFTNR